MLTQFRAMAQHPIAKGMLIILALSFAAWGIGDYISGRQGTTALKVNGEAISVYQLSQAFEQQKQALSQQLGGQALPDETLVQLGLPRQVMADLVRVELLKQAADKLGVQPAPGQVATEIRNLPAFQRDGAFDRNAYEQALRAAGYTVAGFEAAIADDLTTSLLAELFAHVPTTAVAAEPLVAYDNTIYKLRTLEITEANLPSVPAATDASLTIVYEQFADLYRIPEERNLTAVVLEPAKLAAANPTAEDLNNLYEQTITSWQTPGQRKASHILVKTEAEAKDLLAELEAGANFIELAKAHSSDPGSAARGGDLGWFTADQMVPSFAEAAFATAEGALSTPVESPFGWHIIKVTGERPATTKPLAEVKEELTEMWRNRAGMSALTLAAEKIDDAIAGGGNLSDAAATANVEARVVERAIATADTLPAPLLNEAFALSEGEVSLAVDLPNGGIGYVEVKEVIPARVQPFEEVRDMVSNHYKRLQKKQALQQLSQQALLLAREQGLDAAKQNFNLGTIRNMTISRQSENLPEWFQGGVRQAIFNTEASDVVPLTVPTNNGKLLIEVASTQQDDYSSDEVTQAAQALSQNITNDLTWLFLYQLHAKANISYNEPVLKQVFGTTFSLTNLQQGAR